MSELVDFRSEYASALDRALASRLRPKGRLTVQQLISEAGCGRTTLHGWRTGRQAFTLPELRRLDGVLARHGAPGLYAAVTNLPRGRWTSERLPLDAIGDDARRRFLLEWKSGADPLEVAGKMDLLPYATLLARQADGFVSVHVGTALPVDPDVVGRHLLDRSDPDYAGLVYSHMESSQGEPTLYRLTAPHHKYTRLAVPGKRCILTLPFDSVVPDGWRVR